MKLLISVSIVFLLFLPEYVSSTYADACTVDGDCCSGGQCLVWRNYGRMDPNNCACPVGKTGYKCQLPNKAYDLDQESGRNQYRGDMLNAHNTLRRLHKDTDELTLSSVLNADAQEWAETLANRADGLEHDSDRGGNGENLYWRSGGSVFQIKDGTPKMVDEDYPEASVAAYAWYSEFKNYDFTTGDSKDGKAIGHFTQLVWKSTRQLGVGVAVRGRTTWVVCRYSPAGNLDTKPGREDYIENVKPRKPGATNPYDSC